MTALWRTLKIAALVLIAAGLVALNQLAVAYVGDPRTPGVMVNLDVDPHPSK